jgi:hypothetical protein
VVFECQDKRIEIGKKYYMNIALDGASSPIGLENGYFVPRDVDFLRDTATTSPPQIQLC